MNSKLLSLVVMICFTFVTASLPYTPAWDDEYFPTYKPNFIKTRGGSIFDKENCNHTHCTDLPCPDTSPPPYCPDDMPTICPTKCACMVMCETTTIGCFATQHCEKFRRFLVKKKLPPKVTPIPLMY